MPRKREPTIAEVIEGQDQADDNVRDDDALAMDIHRSAIHFASGSAVELLSDQLLDQRARDRALHQQLAEGLALHQERPRDDEPIEIWRAREIARIKAEARASQIDRVQPGGRYFDGGRLVDAEGQPIEDV